MEDTVGFSNSSLIISPLLLISKKCARHLYKETANENKQFKETKIMISNSFFIRKSFHGIVVNLCMESLGIALGNSLNGEVVNQGIEH